MILLQKKFCEQSVTLVTKHPYIIHYLIMSDGHSDLSGCVNKQNMQYWSKTNPYELHLKAPETKRNSMVQDIDIWYHKSLLF
jgi:hypothetical protein